MERSMSDLNNQARTALKAAGIPVVELDPFPGDRVGYTGKLGPFTFTRSHSYYWIVKGPVPIDVANELYADYIGKKDVRSGGHCGCPSPSEYGQSLTAQNGKHVLAQKDVDEFRSFMLKGVIPTNALDRYVLPDTPEAVGAAYFVDLYHIDSQEGLELFADTIKKHKLHLPQNREHLIETLKSVTTRLSETSLMADFNALLLYINDPEITLLVKNQK